MSLKDRLLAEVRERGPMAFAAFMEAALYDPDQGFYARPPVGEGGHFVTSPHVSPAFAALVARQLAESWESLGRPDPFTVIEVGAGDGTLARQIVDAAASVPDMAEDLRYVAVERSPGARELLLEAGIDTRESLAGIDPVTGAILANELLDNLPFHRLRERDGVTVEVMVGTDGDGLVDVEAEPTAEALGSLRGPLRAGEERPVSPEAMDLIREMARVLGRGYSFLFDYGFGFGVTPGPVHAYRDHGVLADVLDEPGSRDVTAAVDLEAVAQEARRAGLQAWGPVTQREALLALGYRLWTSGVRARQAEAEDAGDWREANRLYQARSRASILIDPAKLGGLLVLAFGTEGLPPPAAVLGDRAPGC